MEIRNTRARVLNASERLFAERGFDGTSIRDVTQEAGVNLAAVHYYFGSKDELMAAVLDRTLCPLAQEIGAMLDGAEPNVDGLLEAMVLPHLRLPTALGPRGVTVARLLSRAFSEPNPSIRNLAVERMEGVYGRFARGLQALRPDLCEADINLRMQCVIGIVTFFMQDQIPEAWRVIDPTAPDEAYAQLRTFLLPGLEAAATGPPGQSPGCGDGLPVDA